MNIYFRGTRGSAQVTFFLPVKLKRPCLRLTVLLENHNLLGSGQTWVAGGIAASELLLFYTILVYVKAQLIWY